MLVTLAMALFVQDDIAAKLLTGGRFAALGNRLLIVAMPMATLAPAQETMVRVTSDSREPPVRLDHAIA